MKQTICSKKGITLVELLVVTGIIGIVIMVIGSMILVGVKGYRREVRNAELQTNIRSSMDSILTELHKCESVKDEGGSLVVKTETYTAVFYQVNQTLSCLKTDLSDPSDSHRYILSEMIDVFSYSISGTQCVTIYLKSIENTEGDSVELSSDFYIRR